MFTLNFNPLRRYQDLFIEGVATTLMLTGYACLFGLIIGLLAALALRHGWAPLRFVVRAYVEIIRNTPALIQIFLIFFVLPAIGLRMAPFEASVVALSIYFGAYTTEIIRAGLDSIPKTQIEAANSLGLRPFDVYRYVILPPALRNIYPALTAQIILLLLGTSLASQVSTEDLFHVASFVESRTFRSFETYAVVCTVYCVLVVMFRSVFWGIGRFAFRWPQGR